MKAFKDLEFEPHRIGEGIIAHMCFNNGYGVSVIQTPYSYGNKQGEYELAVLNSEGEITYETPITGDVIGWLSPEEVTYYMFKIQSL